jgi:crossover junction endodeoxyribonuclease RuvC
MIVLGIDPGLSATGYAALEVGNGRPKVLGLGCARSNSRHTLEARLRTIYDQLAEVSRQWQPHLAVLEGLYSDYAYPRTAILMGHVRGVICLAADQSGAKVLEVSPAEVKQALTGSGRATKEQVERAVTRMLSLKESPESDHICDALALALVGAAREGVDLWRT